MPRTKITNLNLFITQYIDDVIPLQSVFSGAVLANTTQNNNTNSNDTTTNTTPDTQTGGGTP